MGKRVCILVMIIMIVFSVHIQNAQAAAVLREGSRGSEVVRLQQRLIELRLLNTRATGVFGPLTHAAVQAFQRANGITANGIAGPVTMGRLFDTTQANRSGTPSAAPANNTGTGAINTVLRRGSRGAEVTTLQNRLNSLGFIIGRSATGVFGPLTHAAVQAFQRANGITADGIVGTTTITRLFPQPQPPVQPEPQPPVQPEPQPPVQPEPQPPAQQEPQPPAQQEPQPPPQPQPQPPAQPVLPSGRFFGAPGVLAGRTVIIDPGHGGFDPGVVRDRIMEKDIVLDISLRLRRILEEAGATVLMTRESDVFRSLLFRSAYANRHVLQLEIERLRREGGTPSVQQTPAPPLQQTPLEVGQNIIAQRDQAMNALVQLQIEMAQNQQRLSDIRTQVAVIQEMLLLLNALELDRTQLKQATEVGNNDAMAIEQSEIFNKKMQLVDRAAQIGLPGSTLEVVNTNLLSRQNESAQITARNSELTRQIATAQRALELLNQGTPIAATAPPVVSPAVPAAIPPTIPQNSIDQINMWSNKIAMFEHFINNPGLRIREGIFASAGGTANNGRAGDMLSRVFDLTRERYQDNIVFISIHNNSTTQNVTEASGIRMFYRHNGPTFAWGAGNPNYYNNYNASRRRSLAQNLLNSLNHWTAFQGEVASPLSMDFSVIRETNLVSALIEVGFLNNAADRSMLIQEQTREDSAAGIYTGLVNYFTSLN